MKYFKSSIISQTVLVETKKKEKVLNLALEN